MAIVEEKVKKVVKKSNFITDQRGGVEIEKNIEELNLGVDVVNEVDNEEDISDLITKIDFKKVSKEKMFNVLVQLVLEVKKIKVHLSKSENESQHNYNRFLEAKNKLNETEKNIHKLAIKISPQYKVFKSSREGLNKHSSVIDMSDFIYRDFLNDKKETQEKMLELLQERADTKKVFDNLTTQLNRYIEGNEMSESNVAEMEDLTEEDLVSIENDGKTKDTVNEIVITEGSEAEFALMTVEVSSVIGKLTDDDKNIIKILGEGVASTQTDIINLASDNFGISEGNTKTSVKVLETLGVVSADLATSFRVRNGFKVIELKQPLGKLVHKKLFGKVPKASEADIIRKAHDNLNHGYSIKDVTEELIKFGYKDVTSDRDKNRIRVAQGKTWIPDIIAVNPTNNANEYFEVESGLMSDDAFSEKLTKAKMKDTVLIVIVPNSMTKDRKKNQVENWKNTSKDTTMDVYIKTYQELTKKEEGYLIKA